MCLSSNNFRSIDYFATIATPRNSEKLLTKRNKKTVAAFDLKFEFETGSVTYGTQTTFVMIEAPAYFEVGLRFFCLNNMLLLISVFQNVLTFRLIDTF